MPEVLEILQSALEHQQAERLEEAEALYREVLARDPENADALHLLGVLACQSRRHELALAWIARAIALNPSASFYHNNLGNVLQELGRFEEAILCYQEALRLEPDYAEACSNLGNALTRLRRYEEAVASALEALRLKPDYAAAYTNLGCTLQALGRVEEAVACHQEALRLQSDHVDAHMNLAAALLLLGDFERGWEEHEWRWKKKESPPRGFPQPLWDGSPLAGRKILLYAEQGLGDTIQYARYVALVRRKGASAVAVECQPRLAPLLETVRGVDLVIPAGSPLPDFDVHAPLLSLPRILRTTLETVPAEVPYLSAEPARVETWGHRMAEAHGLRVGLAWGGNPDYKNDRNRSIPLEALAPLAGVPNVDFFSLQRGPAAAQLRSPPEGFRITNLEEEASQVTDTVAAILNLDLVISVDTMVAHLAGALGRPLWILLPFAPDCRWLLHRNDSPWYPTARLYRQPRPDNWQAVIAEVKEALESRCRHSEKS
jgi:Flp pilus assembly protein TadD